MAFLKKPLKWTALGQEPSELKKNEGFKMDESPAPGHFDFMFRSTYEAIEELQQKAGEVKTVNNVQPDVNGNVLITLPDVSKFYQKPTAGIPKTDLSADVQTSLTKAESALQSVPLATAALDGLMAKSDKISLDNVMSVFANLQKMKITNDDGSAVYTIGAALPTVKKGIFHAVAGSGTYAPPAPSVEGIIIAESASYWNFIGASDNGTWCVGTFQGSWKGWTTLATAKDVSNLSTRITALETSDTTHQAEDATTTKKGHVQLSSSADSNSDAFATTPNAVRKKVDQSSLKMTKSNKDSNGIYTTVTYSRKSDGSKFAASVLSGGTSPQYTTRTVTYYGIDGTTVEKTDTFTLTYDADGDLLSEV
ncbi:tail fiber protein [Kurthia gibsonii]|uniref:tail fiber protein n=1 Tax=Kurthia gibsonii TaxID=33946 RepID=UPI0031B67E4D